MLRTSPASASLIDVRPLEARGVKARVADRRIKDGLPLSPPARRCSLPPGPDRALDSPKGGRGSSNTSPLAKPAMSKQVSLPSIAKSPSQSSTASLFRRGAAAGMAAKPATAAKLSKTIQGAAAAGLSQVQIINAEKVLQQDRETEALTVAVLRGDPNELRTCLVRARQAGVSKALLDTASGKVEQLDAFDAIVQAMEAEDAPRMKEAIAAARQAEIEQSDIEAADQMLARVEARGRLRAAMELQKANALSWAIDEAEILGLQSVGDPVLVEAKAFLGKLRAG